MCDPTFHGSQVSNGGNLTAVKCWNGGEGTRIEVLFHDGKKKLEVMAKEKATFLDGAQPADDLATAFVERGLALVADRTGPERSE